MAAYGHMDEYRQGQDWDEYVERLEQYFIANSIEDAAQKRAIFLTVCGRQTYSLIRNLLSPTKPTDKTFTQLTVLMKTYFNPKPLVIAERFKFSQRQQKPGELVKEFVAALRKLAEHCNFGDFLNEALRDRLVSGLSSHVMRQRLLGKEVDLQETIQIAESMEIAEQQANEFKQDRSKINRVGGRDRRERANSVECFRCGSVNHEPESCYYKKSRCYNCKEAGHLRRKCPKPEAKGSSTKPSGSKEGKLKKKSSKIRLLAKACEDTEAFVQPDTVQEWPLFSVNSNFAEEIVIPLEIESQQCEMELDTGASLSIISEDLYKEKFKDIPMRTTEAMLKTYTGEVVPVVGQIEVEVQYGEQKERLPLIVVRGSGPPLFGRNWLAKISLNWQVIKKLPVVQSVENLMVKYADVFEDTLGTVKGVTAKLELKAEAKPKFFKPRPVPYALKGKINDELQRLETLGVVEKVSYSTWAAPIVPVLKPDGTVRICGDYKVTVNNDLEVHQYPLPKAADLFANLNGGKKFSKLDLSHAYQQVLLDNESRAYVTINTHLGLYRYTRLPFGVASAPAVFQETMDKVLAGLQGVGCILDDLLITGKDDAEHFRNLEATLQRLQQFGIKLKRKKCALMQPSVEYFAFKVDASGIQPSAAKVEAISKVPVPQNVKELQSFLGLVNYYRKFIPEMSSISQPLNQLLGKGVKWSWESNCQAAFESLKAKLTTAGVLVHYDPEKPLVLATDASPWGLGAVLSHVYPGGEERPIAFASRSLSSAEKNYSQIEKEALAIIFGIQKFHEYLYGRRFTLITDHQPLITILGPKTGIPVLAASRLQRWAIKLSAYQYDIKYRSSTRNGNADGLSRLPVTESNVSEMLNGEDEVSMINNMQINNLPVSARNISHATQHDPTLSRVKNFLLNGWPEEKECPTEVLPYYRHQTELSVEEGCLLRGIRVIIPEKYQRQVLETLHENHPGIVKMKSLARMHVWWPNFDVAIEQCVKDCHDCQVTRAAPPSAPLNPWLWPRKPWQRIHVDFLGPFMNEMFMVVVDARSKWPEIFRMSSTAVGPTVKALRFLFAAYGLPEQLVSDNGPQFTSHEFKEFLKTNGIAHILSAPYHPSSNGEAERMVRTFKEAMKLKKDEPGNLSQKIAAFLLSYRSTPHRTTNCTPAELFLGRQLRTRLTLLRPDLRNTVQKNQVSFPSSRKLRFLAVGEPVLVRDYRARSETWIRGVVVEKRGPLTYGIQVGDHIWKRHIDQLYTLENSSTPVSPRPDHFLPDPPTPVNSSTQRVETNPPDLTILPNIIQDTTVNGEPNTVVIPNSEESQNSSTPSSPVDAVENPINSRTITPVVSERRYPARVRIKPKRFSEQ